MWKKWNTIFFNCRYSIGRSSSSRFYPLGWRSRYWYATFRLWTFYNGLCYRFRWTFFLQKLEYMTSILVFRFPKLDLIILIISSGMLKRSIFMMVYMLMCSFWQHSDNYKLQRWQNLQSYILKRLILIKNNYKCWEKREDGKIN